MHLVYGPNFNLPINVTKVKIDRPTSVIFSGCNFEPNVAKTELRGSNGSSL